MEQDHLRGVFIDPRELGSEVLLIFLPSQAMTIEQICSRAEIPLERGWQVDVGAVFYSPGSGTVSLGEQTVLTFTVRPFQHWAKPNARRESSSGSNSDDGHEQEGNSNADDGNRSGVELDFTPPSSEDSRSRSPRRGPEHRGDDLAGRESLA